jgi:hypothetical protein
MQTTGINLNEFKIHTRNYDCELWNLEIEHLMRVNLRPSQRTQLFAMSSISGNSGAVNEISLIYDAAAELSKLKSWIDIESNDSRTAGKRNYDLLSGWKFNTK